MREVCCRVKTSRRDDRDSETSAFRAVREARRKTGITGREGGRAGCWDLTVTGHGITPSTGPISRLPEVLDETVFVGKIEECEQERYPLFDFLSSQSVETSKIN